MKNIKYLYLSLVVILVLSSCEGFLEEKPEKSILVPKTKEDVRALLDYYTQLNDNTLVNFILSDDWQTEDANWERLAPWEQNAYLWKTQVFEPTERSTDYSKFYRKVFTANVSLDVLEKLGLDTEIQQLKGEALFIRALAYFELATLFLPSPGIGSEEIKLPVKLSPNINEASEWWSISEVLNLVEEDLWGAYELMASSSQFKNRPNKKVAKAVLARLYLYEGRWEEALDAATEVLEQEQGNLLDYHELDSTAAYPFTLFNSEVLYYGVTSSFSVTASAATFINPDLREKYRAGDLRAVLFFSAAATGESLFKGSYNGDYNLFTGIALPEMYLTAGESLIRLERTEEGLALLGMLAEKRYQSWEDWEVQLAKEPLDLVLEERQKEQVFRGTRWMDMKRLFAMGEVMKFPVREIRGELYSLPAPESQFLALPASEVELENR